MGTRDGRGVPLSMPTPGRIDSELVYDGRVVRLSVDTVRFPDGSEGQLEMIRHAGASAVLPFLGGLLDPDPDVILVRQYRYAYDGYLYEVPACRLACRLGTRRAGRNVRIGNSKKKPACGRQP